MGGFPTKNCRTSNPRLGTKRLRLLIQRRRNATTIIPKFLPFVILLLGMANAAQKLYVPVHTIRHLFPKFPTEPKHIRKLVLGGLELRCDPTPWKEGTAPTTTRSKKFFAVTEDGRGKCGDPQSEWEFGTWGIKGGETKF